MRARLANCVNTVLGATASLIFSGLCCSAPVAAQEADFSATRAEQLESAADLLSATGLGDWHLALAAADGTEAASADAAEVGSSTFDIVDETPPAPAAAKRPPLDSQQIALRDRVRRALGLYYRRQLSSSENTPWEMMHGIIAYGVETQIHRGGQKGELVNAVSYVCWNGPCRALELLYLDRGRINARKGPYVQGHYGQFLAILAQSRVPRNYPMRAEGKNFTVEDLIATEKLTCATGMELTFKLISIAHYCDLDETWKNEKGETWSIPRLIAEELKAPILSNAPCGGTHRLTALAYAVHNREAQGKKLDGQWLAAKKYLDQYHKYTLALQNRDGSFSTEWFRRREARPDIDRRLQTTGHILEWLVYSLPASELNNPRVVNAVEYLSGIMLTKPDNQWEIGPLGHAIHALSIYDQRVYKPHDAPAAAVASDSLDFTKYRDEAAQFAETTAEPAAEAAPIYQARANPKPASTYDDEPGTQITDPAVEKQDGPALLVDP